MREARNGRAEVQRHRVPPLPNERKIPQLLLLPKSLPTPPPISPRPRLPRRPSLPIPTRHRLRSTPPNPSRRTRSPSECIPTSEDPAARSGAAGRRGARGWRAVAEEADEERWGREEGEGTTVVLRGVDLCKNLVRFLGERIVRGGGKGTYDGEEVVEVGTGDAGEGLESGGRSSGEEVDRD